MKKHINIIGGIILMWLMFGFTSCTSYLDRTPDSVVSSTDAFVNFTNFQGYVEQIYALVPDYTAVTWADNWMMGDEAINSVGGAWVDDKFDEGDYWGWQEGWIPSWLNGDGNVHTASAGGAEGLWPNAWAGIRDVNLGLENLDKLTDATQEQKDFIKGQLLFFRGWFYFELSSYFGGLPYITHVLSPTDNLAIPRLSYQQTADSIAKDLRAAADLLPVDWDSTATGAATKGNNTLRINKMMCLGYLGKDYLYAGSPLMNKESTGSATYNKGYCQKAAAAFAEMLQYVDNGKSWLHLVPFSQYSNLFWSGGSSQMPGYQEDVFTYSAFGTWLDGCPWGPASIFSASSIGGGYVSPNANYVDNYGMANGLPITDPNSGYDPNNPWANRDPRFYHDIVIDGDQQIYGAAPADKEHYRDIALYTSGEDRTYNGGASSGRTGYLIRKFTPMTCNNIDNYSGGGYMHLAYMRLSDVYLMYAEAVLQGYGSATSTAPGYNLTAEQAVDKIRTRAGVGPVGSAYVSDPQKFMSEIIRERAVELSFEADIRFNDLRRWMLWDNKQYLEKTAIDFDRGTVSVPASEIPSPGIHYEPVNMTKRVILTRVFHDFNYWLPIPTKDVYLYVTFPQNPGY
ncbi:RagB/SusD family nutrient uptake outer membrane protein [Microbacter margulisiae]|uniref:RagB/SusD family nutrient uptake outer membrane protein n=1 Tax=Microbacter margulisiae TaxID=1350067 RepID=A0A7W5DS89_9PORP|nr:RagB/SusD family nutrient uptake outer membrane protein [Microbacter margulisiae]MBB3188126.1 hypothetical protein [Microbacter margulisiae]